MATPNGTAAGAAGGINTNNVEMDNLAATLTGQPPSLDQQQRSGQPQEQEQDATAGAQQTDGAADPASSSSIPPAAPAQQQADGDNDLKPISTATSTTHPPRGDALTRKETEALGPATDDPIVPPPSTGPVLSITLMLITGARHPYKIDEKYLRARKVLPRSVGGGGGEEGALDPRELSGYQLKELIWADWRGEWEPRPASPSSIRLIILGRFIEDKMVLKDMPFKADDTNVVHMTVKPADFVDDEENMGKGAGGKGHSIRGRDDGEGGAGCRCVIL